jgi:hypothetical protein
MDTWMYPNYAIGSEQLHTFDVYPSDILEIFCPHENRASERGFSFRPRPSMQLLLPPKGIIVFLWH